MSKRDAWREIFFFFFLIHLRNLEQLLERVLGIWC